MHRLSGKNAKSAGDWGTIAPARGTKRTVLVAKSKSLDQRPIPFQIRALEIIEQPAPATDHLQQALAAVMILRVGPEMIGQVVDPVGQQRHLDAGRAGVGLAGSVLQDRRCFFKCHVIYSPRRPRSVSAYSCKPGSLLDLSPSVKAWRVA